MFREKVRINDFPISVLSRPPRSPAEETGEGIWEQKMLPAGSCGMKISNFGEELIPGAPAPRQKLENTDPAQLHHLPRRIQLLLPKMPLPAHPQLYIPNSLLKILPEFILLHQITKFGYLEWAAPSNTQLQVEISIIFPSCIYNFHCEKGTQSIAEL